MSQQQRLVPDKAAPQIKKAQTPAPQSPPCSARLRPHLNSLWSLWYGVVATGVNALLIAQCVRRFGIYAGLPWPEAPPKFELNVYLGLAGLATLLLPFFLVCAIFKVGNLANDGCKLGHSGGSCSRDEVPLLERGGMCSSLWRHGGPTAPFLHAAAAFSLLLTKLVMEAKLIKDGFLPKSEVWSTDLDWILPAREQLVVLSFLSPPPPLLNTSLLPLPATPSPSPLTPLLTDTAFSLGSLSPEYINYAAALAVYSVRYPAVFWRTHKKFGSFFSIHLFTAAAHILVVFCGVSVLYKLQVCYGSRLQQGLLLDATVTLPLFALACALTMCSSLVLYLHGYCKFASFMSRERSKRGEITIRKEVAWGYFPHCAALCVLAAAGVVYAPILHDCAALYRASLDTALLSGVLAALASLLLWAVTWLILTATRRWSFKILLTVATAKLTSARSVRLVTEVSLSQKRLDVEEAPLLVLGHGRTFTVHEAQPKRAIMAAVHRTQQQQQQQMKSGVSSSSSSITEQEQVYWLRPGRAAQHKGKHKVTFEDSKLRRGSEDDGDYATLRQLPLSHSDTEESKLLERVRDGTVTYASAQTCDMLQPESPASSVLLLLPDPAPAIAALPPPPDSHQLQVMAGITPRCLLGRADSGVQGLDEARSDSASPGSSPPEHSNSSETSSGVHSASSGVHSGHSGHSGSSPRRANSVEDLPGSEIQHPTWRNLSLQRGTQPPTQAQYGGTQPPTQSMYGFTGPSVPTIPETTVVIRRKQQTRPKTADLSAQQEPFERCTNMRMTSFTDDYPTRQQLGLCHSFPRSMQTTFQPPQPSDGSRTLPNSHPPNGELSGPLYCHSYPRLQHTTIPTHHNGVRLFPSRRLPHVTACKYSPLPHPAPAHLTHDRDSANFSMGSSGDSSDSSYIQHPA